MLIQNSFKYLLKQTKSQWNFINYTSTRNSSAMKVCVLGATGHIGQPLCLLLKQLHLIDELALYDVQETNGLAIELRHIDTKCKIINYKKDEINGALQGSSVVAITAAQLNTCGKNIGYMFQGNAPIMAALMECVAKTCPRSLIAIGTHPVNSMVPLASEIMRRNSVLNPRKIFGVTTLNVVRANTFVAETLGLEPECVHVPVIGGHDGETIIPLLSQAQPCTDFTLDELEKITKALQTAHCDVLQLKQEDSATLSTAFAIARFVSSLVKAAKGQADIVECAYVRCDVYPNLSYIAIPVQIGAEGVQRHIGLQEMSEYEKCLLDKAVPMLKADINLGINYVSETMGKQTECDYCDPSPKAPLCPPDHCAKEKFKL